MVVFRNIVTTCRLLLNLSSEHSRSFRFYKSNTLSQFEFHLLLNIVRVRFLLIYKVVDVGLVTHAIWRLHSFKIINNLLNGADVVRK